MSAKNIFWPDWNLPDHGFLLKGMISKFSAKFGNKFGY